MANRNDSDSRQHETLPGPGPGPSASRGGGARPVEQMVDSAIERLARERERPIELSRRTSTAEALARRDSTPRLPTRLRWKGLDVSDEFREYAERVARGEDLPPFEGRVLAEPNAEFPWGNGAPRHPEPPKKRNAHPVLWGSAIVMLGLIGWSLVLRVQAPATSPSALEASFAPSSIETRVEPLTPTEGRTEPVLGTSGTTPHDVVETAPASPTPTLDTLANGGGAGTPNEPLPAPPAPVTPSAVTPTAVAPLPPRAPVAAAPAAAAQVATPAAPASPSTSVTVDLARAGALEQAVGAALSARGAGAAASSGVEEDEFGIMAAHPAPVPAAPPAPAGAKSNGNVGDLSQVGQPQAPGVRKEPGSESSAKGSLLVENPSF